MGKPIILPIQQEKQDKTKPNLGITPITHVIKKNMNLETFRSVYIMIKIQVQIFSFIIFKAHIKTNDFKKHFKRKRQ